MHARSGGGKAERARIGHCTCVETLCYIIIDQLTVAQSPDHFIYQLGSGAGSDIADPVIESRLRLQMMIDQYLYAVQLFKMRRQGTRAVERVKVQAEQEVDTGHRL